MSVSKPARPDSEDARRNPYLQTDAENEALGALETTAGFLEAAAENPEMWKWTILALHNAVQGFMVLALSGSTNWGTLRDEDIASRVQAEHAYRSAAAAGDTATAQQAQNSMLFSPSRLASFQTLYSRIKSSDWWMLKYMNSKHYVPRATDDQCITDLDSVRNEFAHFVPMSRSFLLTQFPAMTATGLHIIDFLVNESGNIHWFSDSAENRFKSAYARAVQSLARIEVDYAGLPLPGWPLCGSQPE